MKILIFGASGTVGNAIFNTFSEAGGYNVFGTYNANKPADCTNFYKWDIENIPALKEILSEINPVIIISSLTGDFLRQSAAHDVMADYLQETGGRVVFISTVNVFDGLTCGNHSEATPPYNISQYGGFKQKTEEMLLRRLGDKALVARLPKITTDNEAAAITRQIKNGGVFYSNLYFNLNTPQNAANAIKYCVEENKCGIIHLTGSDYISDSGYASLILKAANINEEIPTRILTDETYCNLLGCDDISRLKATEGGFFLTMTCGDKTISEKFGYSPIRHFSKTML